MSRNPRLSLTNTHNLLNRSHGSFSRQPVAHAAQSLSPKPVFPTAFFQKCRSARAGNPVELVGTYSVNCHGLIFLILHRLRRWRGKSPSIIRRRSHISSAKLPCLDRGTAACRIYLVEAKEDTTYLSTDLTLTAEKSAGFGPSRLSSPLYCSFMSTLHIARKMSQPRPSLTFSKIGFSNISYNIRAHEFQMLSRSVNLQFRSRPRSFERNFLQPAHSEGPGQNFSRCSDMIILRSLCVEIYMQSCFQVSFY